MTDIRTIIEEAVGSVPAGKDCPHCGAIGSVVTPTGAAEDICKKCGKPVVNNEDKTKDMEPTNPDAVSSHTKSDVFERLMPMQLNALMETLIRNKKQFDVLYSTLASEGFVPIVENADYDAKRAVLNEMLKDGTFTKHMLETLVEMNHLEVGKMTEMINPDEDDSDGEIKTFKDLLKAPKDKSVDEPKEPTKVPNATKSLEKSTGIKFKQIGSAKEELNIAEMSLQDIIGKLREYADLFGFIEPKEVEIEDQDEDGNPITKKEFLSPLRQFQKYWNDWKNFGKIEARMIKNSKTGEDTTFSPEDQVEWLEDTSKLMEKAKTITGTKHKAERTVKPPVRVGEPIEVDETKNKQLNMGTGKSELQLRAGAKGNIFESRMKKLEPYKKIALLEFLENDPKMLDDKDYTDMSTLTGICEEELVLMRMEYENIPEDISETINYPVFGGKDVRGQNVKNAKTQIDRDLKGATKSQETTEEKVFKAKKFRLEDATKSSIENTDKQDQNRGQHSLVAVLNDKDGSQKEKYEAQADGYPSAENKKMHDELPDSRSRDAGKASDRDDADVGGEMLKKGEEQEVERQNEPIYPKEQVPTTGGKEKGRKMVAEDLDRIKGLFTYNAGNYSKAKPKNDPETVFEQQIRDMRVLSESVDTTDRPTAQQLNEMEEVEFKGQPARTDGQHYFNPADGAKLGECGAMEECSMEEGARNPEWDKEIYGELKRKYGLDPTLVTFEQTPTGIKLNVTDFEIFANKFTNGDRREQIVQPVITRIENAINRRYGKNVQSMEEARGHQLEAGQEIDPKQLYAGTQAKAFASREFDMNKMNEGKDTGKLCTECRHTIWEVDGKDKCMCEGAPTEECSDPMGKETDRMKKLSGVDEAKRLQLKHSKGHQLQTGTKKDEEIVDEAKRLQLKHSKGHQLETGTKKEEDVIDEAKNLQLKHSKGLQLKAGTKTIEDDK